MKPIPRREARTSASSPVAAEEELVVADVVADDGAVVGADVGAFATDVVGVSLV